MDIVKTCGCVIEVHEYDDFAGEKFRLHKFRCEQCTKMEEEQIKRNELENKRRMERYERRRQHLEDLAAMNITDRKRVPLSVLIEKIVKVLGLQSSIYNQHHFRNQMKADPLLMNAFRILKIRNRYCFEKKILDFSDLFLIFK